VVIARGVIYSMGMGVKGKHTFKKITSERDIPLHEYEEDRDPRYKKVIEQSVRCSLLSRLSDMLLGIDGPVEVNIDNSWIDKDVDSFYKTFTVTAEIYIFEQGTVRGDI